MTKFVLLFFMLILWNPTIVMAGETICKLPTQCRVQTVDPDTIDLTAFGAVGDGVTDDSVAIQQALTECSIKNLTCRVPKGKTFLIRQPVYIWGGANMIGEDGTGTLLFDTPAVPYLFHVGISGRSEAEAPFTGRINYVRFVVKSPGEGRLLFFWRTRNAVIADNTFDFGDTKYSATSSGNDNAWLARLVDYIREDITIVRNSITARADNGGSEGIGLGWFDGALIKDNEIIGVGDDMIGIHFCRNIRILDNTVKGVDGRLFVSNSVNVEIAGNSVSRMASRKDGKFYQGISLIYIGFESRTSSAHFPPTNILIHDNRLYYPPGAIDAGAAIYLYAVRDAAVRQNHILTDSPSVISSGLHMLPALLTVSWTDPTERDEPCVADEDTPCVARVHNVVVMDNFSGGAYPLGMKMTGNCVAYPGKVKIKGNHAKFHAFYCPNVSVVSPFSTDDGA